MTMKLLRVNLPLLIIAFGVFFSLYLLSTISDEVYFSGDAGLKALLAKQFSSGNLRFDLNLQVPAWANQLWEQGLYPFEEPFAYKIANRYYITFPFTFPLITAPFYRLFGFRGLYIIPLVSTWIIWLNFYKLCRFFQLGMAITSVALATLIFASPLSLYSAMYWEHTLAVCLAFSGFAIILTKGEKDFSRRDAIASGVLIGAAVWFRPEFLALAAIISVLVAISYKIDLGKITFIRHQKTIFLLSLSITIISFFLLNQIIYGHPLGVHALQVVEEFSPRVRLANAEKIFASMRDKFLSSFPVIYFAFVFLGLSIFSDTIKLTSGMRKILLIATLFGCLVPIFLPSDGGKQWGARFLLILVPMLVLLTVLALKMSLSMKKFGVKYISSAAFTALFIIGLHINIYLGINYCYAGKNSETLNLLRFLRADSNQVVAVAHQYVSQTFESVFNQKIFFLTKSQEDINQLSVALKSQNLQKFIYICPSYDACFSSPQIPDVLEIATHQPPLRVNFKEIKKTSKYIVREGVIN